MPSGRGRRGRPARAPVDEACRRRRPCASFSFLPPPSLVPKSQETTHTKPPEISSSKYIFEALIHAQRNTSCSTSRLHPHPPTYRYYCSIHILQYFHSIVVGISQKCPFTLSQFPLDLFFVCHPTDTWYGTGSMSFNVHHS